MMQTVLNYLLIFFLGLGAAVVGLIFFINFIYSRCENKAGEE